VLMKGPRKLDVAAAFGRWKLGRLDSGGALDTAQNRPQSKAQSDTLIRTSRQLVCKVEQDEM
jgi:hypothetical protein